MQRQSNYHFRCIVWRWATIGAALTVLLSTQPAARAVVLPTADGYYGIWYAVGASGDEYAYKYSGGLGTYMQQTSPLAIYSAAVDRTYFVYGGTDGTSNVLKNYLSYYDHATGLLARPREVRHVGGSDNHRNVTFTLDDDGYLYVFGNSHGNTGAGNLYKSSQPFAIAEFNEVPLPGSVFNNTSGQVKLSYSNPYYVSGSGIMLVYNQYHDGRAVHVATSPDGLSWTDTSLFDTNQGHYALARQNGNTIGVSADYHRSGSLDNRTNLYYFQTTDFGQSWTNAAGTALSTPLTSRDNAALVYDYFAENKLVYMKDIDYDAAGNPILLYLTVSDATGNGHLSGPQPGGRTLHTAHWTGGQWQIRNAMMTDHNYDHGELYVEPDGTWRIIGPYLDGPQLYGTGGEVGMWTSQNQGASWQLVDELTYDSQFNHTYVRQPANAHEDFYAYWADGNAFAQSTSSLYFATKDGDVYRMPTHFTGNFAAPVLVTDFSGPDPNPDPDPDPQSISPAHEAFDYASGPAIAGRNGGSGWGGPWVDSQSNFAHLKYTGASPNSPAFPFTPTGGWVEGIGGSATRALNGGIDLARQGTEVFISFLFRKNQDGSASGDNVELGLNAGGAQVVRVGSTSDDKFFLGVSVGGGNAVVGDPLTIGETYVVVLKGVTSALGSDTFYASFYDTTSLLSLSEPSEWDITWSMMSSAVLDTIRLAIGANAWGALDEIRIGASWADVAAAALAGDFNGDGAVDAADYVVWRKTAGLSPAYNEWRENFGRTSGDGEAAGNNSNSHTAIPEPPTIGMLLGPFLLLLTFGCRHVFVQE